MEAKQKNSKYQVGNYWLAKNRNGMWCRSWNDSQAGQRKTASLGTKSLQRAKELLDEWFTENHNPILEEDLLLSTCFLKYNEYHAQFRARAKNTQSNMVKWLTFFPEKMVKEIRPLDQRRFIKHLVSQGYSENYIKDIFKSGASAIRFAWKNDMLAAELPLIGPHDELINHDIRPKESAQPQDIKDIARFFEHCNQEHTIRFMMMLIGTACRPSAAIEVEGNQIDLKAKTIDLLKTGKKQSNKYRPTVKLPIFIEAIYHDENICYQSKKWLAEKKPTDSLKTSFKSTVRRAGLDDTFVFYSIRHTMAKWLRASGVDPWQVSCQLGHTRKGSEITEIYAPNGPDYLSESLAAIERYFELLLNESPRLKEFMSCTNYSSLLLRC